MHMHMHIQMHANACMHMHMHLHLHMHVQMHMHRVHAHEPHAIMHACIYDTRLSFIILRAPTYDVRSLEQEMALAGIWNM